MAEEVLQVLFQENQEMEDWWIATFDELKDILPENLKFVQSKDVVAELKRLIKTNLNKI